jgi:hypothetical protein
VGHSGSSFSEPINGQFSCHLDISMACCDKAESFVNFSDKFVRAADKPSPAGICQRFQSEAISLMVESRNLLPRTNRIPFDVMPSATFGL